MKHKRKYRLIIRTSEFTIIAGYKIIIKKAIAFLNRTYFIK